MCPSVCSYGYPSVVYVLVGVLVLLGVAAYSPPSTASRVGAVLLIPPSVAGTTA